MFCFVAFREREVFRYLLPMVSFEGGNLVMCGVVVSQSGKSV